MVTTIGCNIWVTAARTVTVTSASRVLIDRGEVPKEQMSMKAIKEWANRQPEESVKELVEQNPPMSSSSVAPPTT